MEKILQYIPGFRSNKTWKKIIASIYYIFCLLGAFSGFGAVLILFSIPFIIFSGIRLIKHKNKTLGIIFITSIFLLVIGTKLPANYEANLDNSKTVTADVTPAPTEAVTEPAKTAEEIKKEEEQAKLDAIQKTKDDAAAKKIADAQAIKDKKEADALALSEKKAADALALSVKKEAEAKAQAEKVAYDTGITYNQLARTPDKYKSMKVKFSGEVIQVTEGENETDLRVLLNDNYDTILLVYYDPSIMTERILEGDFINIKGVSQGIYTYEATSGANISLPLVSADMIN